MSNRPETVRRFAEMIADHVLCQLQKPFEELMSIEAKLLAAYKAQNAALNKTNADLGTQLNAVEQQIAALSAQLAATPTNAKDAEDLVAEETARVDLKLDANGDPLS